MALGNQEKTSRGFELIEFDDSNGEKCSLQQSSATGTTDDAVDRPGSSFVWLGVSKVEPSIMKSQAKRMGLELPPGEVSGWMPFPIPDGVQLSGRMHLSREQVDGLVVALNCWLENGTFNE